MSELVGRTLAKRYRVDLFLGKGGMAEVYKVWDSKRSVDLALKVLNADLAEDVVFVRRFRREGQTLAKLLHPNIVRFFDLEQDGDLVFILMDFVDGTTLRKEIFRLRKPLPMGRVLEIMQPVCRALNYAHELGYVHCDVKPANIMIDSRGTVLVSDFGIARMSESSTTTLLGAGTPAYMAPEQVRGESPTPQTDIYALGIVLYEMLTGGERPFTGENAQTTGSTAQKIRWEHVKLAPRPPRSYNPNIPPALEAVVLRCLDKDPERRYRSAMELLGALVAAGGEPVPEMPRRPAAVQAKRLPTRQARPAAQAETVAAEVRKEPASPRNVSRRPVVVAGAMLGAFALLGLGALAVLGIRAAGTARAAMTQTAAVTNTPVPTSTPAPPTLTPTPALDVGSMLPRAVDDATMMYVPAGPFTMGYADGEANERFEHEVYVDAFWIDRLEVTYGAYAECVAAGQCKKANQGLNKNDAPVISVPFEEAKDYCEWATARLPTEAEWEKAARGDEGGIYPWGSEYDKTRVAQFTWDGVLEPVGGHPEGASPYGVLDMAGGAFEWVSDWYDSTFYSYSPRENPTGPQTGKQHVIRGGWWEYCPSYFICNLKPTYRSTYRNGTGNYGRGGSGPAWIYYPWAGIRCAKDADGSGGSQSAAPTAAVLVSAQETAQPARTAASFMPGAMPIAYDQKMVSIPRQETLVYGFEGNGSDVVTVVLEMFNAHDKMLFCQQRVPGSRSTFTVQTDDQKELEPSGYGGNPKTTRMFTLPYTGIYYIHVTCRGNACDAFCVEQDLTLTKNP